MLCFNLQERLEALPKGKRAVSREAVGLGACLVCLISPVKAYQGQALQDTQELAVLVLWQGCINELKGSLQAQETSGILAPLLRASMLCKSTFLKGCS